MRIRLLVPTGVYVVILGLSSLPADDLSMLPPWTNWVGHVLEYAVLGVALRWSLHGTAAATAFTVGMIAALAGIDEAYQSTVPGRDPSVLDWIVDLVAGAVAATTYGRWRS